MHAMDKVMNIFKEFIMRKFYMNNTADISCSPPSRWDSSFLPGNVQLVSRVEFITFSIIKTMLYQHYSSLA